MQRRHLQKVTVGLSLLGACAATWVLIAGAGAADGATRFRSGARAHLLDSSTRIAPNGAGAPGLHLTGPNVMAAAVGVMAVLAFLFLVVTFIRRRGRAPRITAGTPA